MCEILIITLFVVLKVVPLAAVLIAVEFMTRGKALRRNMGITWMCEILIITLLLF